MKKNFTDVDLNRSVGNLLRLGVILSVATSLIGFIKLLLKVLKCLKIYKPCSGHLFGKDMGPLLGLFV
ncbi:hypothetical protein EJ377_03540 [Chryseobacterium arthrosphaerae]|uniref:Uncharacterized protein n=1 Tax=Chryseobacterium arthrosphaerae TaxID=651561 RepID=A0A3S0NNQ8_9FLAO|nr:hypothetical protein EJ377_03540 [Chryseobacterium arthrosphaerae]